MTRWISCSRPMTGSSLLDLAAEVRSMPSSSRVGVRAELREPELPEDVGVLWLSIRWVSGAHLVQGHSQALQDPGGDSLSLPQQADEQVLGAYVGVVHAAGLVHRQLHDLLGPGGKPDLALGGPFAPADDELDGGPDLVEVHPQVGQDPGRDTLGLSNEA